MNIINITLEEYNNLKPYNTKENSNIEGKLFYYKENQLLKSFIKKEVEEDSYTKDKYINLLTIKEYENELKEIVELILPKNIVKINNIPIGDTMPLLRNCKSLKNILQNPRINFKYKINLLTQIGQLLEKLSQLKKVHLGDLHEDNILVTKDNKIKVIDTDSISLNNGIWFPSKYIVESLVLEDYPEKYKQNSQEKITYSKNTDIYCYIIIILNTLANFQMHRLIQSEFFDYIDYLESIDIPYEFLDLISKIYSTSDNVNPLPYLNTLPLEKLELANHLIYTKKTGKPIMYLN